MPALGTVRLERLTHVHVARLVADLEAAGRSAVTVRRIVATLSSAMSDAIKRRRLAHNPASHVTLPTVERTERGGWGVAEGVAFLAYVADQGDRDGELWELLIGTGIRKGEARRCGGATWTSAVGCCTCATRCRASITRD